MQFDFNVGPNQSQHLDVVGSFIKYKAGTGTIRVRLNGGGYIDLLPGQGVNNVNFTGVDVQDRTGAQNVGTILAGIYDFRDDRITGDVSVIDNAKARTLTGVAFMGAVRCQANAGELPYVELWNPASSTKNLVLESVTLAASVACLVDYGPAVNPISTAYGYTPRPKRFPASGAPIIATQGQFYTQSYSLDMLGNGFGTASIGTSPGQKIDFKEPIVLLPGAGLLVKGNTTGALLVMTAEYFEDPM